MSIELSVYRLECDRFGPFLYSSNKFGLSDEERSLAEALREIIMRYLSLFEDELGLKEPSDDGLTSVPWSYKFGCTSLETLRTWFPSSALAVAHKLGFKIVEHKVPRGDFKLGHSGKQVMFYDSEEFVNSMLTIPEFIAKIDEQNGSDPDWEYHPCHYNHFPLKVEVD